MVSGPEAQADDPTEVTADEPAAVTAEQRHAEPSPGDAAPATEPTAQARTAAVPAPEVAAAPVGEASARPALREASGLKMRGVFVIMTAFATVGCIIGFVTSGTVSIPSAAGWGLLLGSITAAVLSPARLGWTAAWMPPLAITAVIVVMGQFTFLGSMPTFAREVAMVAANLTAMAPAQLLSVAAAAGILLLKRRLLAR